MLHVHIQDWYLEAYIQLTTWHWHWHWKNNFFIIWVYWKGTFSMTPTVRRPLVGFSEKLQSYISMLLSEHLSIHKYNLSTVILKKRELRWLWRQANTKKHFCMADISDPWNNLFLLTKKEVAIFRRITPFPVRRDAGKTNIEAIQ